VKKFPIEIKVWTLENGPGPIIGFQGFEIYVSRPLMIVKTCLIAQNVRNGHIYIDVMKQHIPQTAYFLRKSSVSLQNKHLAVSAG
jgi:hypothetical protein